MPATTPIRPFGGTRNSYISPVTSLNLVVNEVKQVEDLLLGKLVVWSPMKMHGKVGTKVKMYKYDRVRKESINAWTEHEIGTVAGMVVDFGQVWDLLPNSYSPGPREDFPYGSLCAVVLCEDAFLVFWAGSLVLASEPSSSGE